MESPMVLIVFTVLVAFSVTVSGQLDPVDAASPQAEGVDGHGTYLARRRHSSLPSHPRSHAVKANADELKFECQPMWKLRLPQLLACTLQSESSADPKSTLQKQSENGTNQSPIPTDTNGSGKKGAVDLGDVDYGQDGHAFNGVVDGHDVNGVVDNQYVNGVVDDHDVNGVVDDYNAEEDGRSSEELHEHIQKEILRKVHGSRGTKNNKRKNPQKQEKNQRYVYYYEKHF